MTKNKSINQKQKQKQKKIEDLTDLDFRRIKTVYCKCVG